MLWWSFSISLGHRGLNDRAQDFGMVREPAFCRGSCADVFMSRCVTASLFLFVILFVDWYVVSGPSFCFSFPKPLLPLTPASRTKTPYREETELALYHYLESGPLSPTPEMTLHDFDNVWCWFVHSAMDMTEFFLKTFFLWTNNKEIWPHLDSKVDVMLEHERWDCRKYHGAGGEEMSKVKPLAREIR